MKKRVLYAQILYLGFVSEKGKVYKNLWRWNYRWLFSQVKMWENIIKLMGSKNFDSNDLELLDLFVKQCEQNEQMKKNYKLVVDQINELKYKNYIDIEVDEDINSNSNLISSLIEELLVDVEYILNSRKIFVPKHKISELLEALHNLPRYFLEVRTEASQDPMLYAGVGFSTAINYCFSNMSNSLKERYSKYYGMANRK